MCTTGAARSNVRSVKDYRVLEVVVRDSGMQVVFHLSSRSKGSGLKGPAESGKPTLHYRTGATARGSVTKTMGLTLRNLVYWGLIGYI